jgi:hypothetical protein
VLTFPILKIHLYSLPNLQIKEASQAIIIVRRFSYEELNTLNYKRLATVIYDLNLSSIFVLSAEETITNSVYPLPSPSLH